jgi:hypothetical protein
MIVDTVLFFLYVALLVGSVRWLLTRPTGPVPEHPPIL